MISESEALDRILAHVEPLGSESLPLSEAHGRFAAAAIKAPSALPRFDQSAMDGYAVRSADTPGLLRLAGEQPAGRARDLTIASGETIRIFTGAPLPTGADAVVMQEDVSTEPGGIRISEAIPAGEFIRRRGGDLCEGQLIFAAGDPLTASRIGLLSSAGFATVLAHRRPRVAIITTGDEIRPLGTDLAPGEIYDANGPMLSAHLREAADIVSVSHAQDDPAIVAQAIATSESDAIVLAAGVSVGDHDPVHEALRQLGASVDFWKVSVKPGKPFLYGTLGSRHIFGLPGNPVSAFVTAELFVKPALRRLAGAALDHARPRYIQASLGMAMSNPDSRPHYLRATLREGLIYPTHVQQSHILSGLASADLLIRLEPGSMTEAGRAVPAIFVNFR